MAPGGPSGWSSLTVDLTDQVSPNVGDPNVTHPKLGRVFTFFVNESDNEKKLKKCGVFNCLTVNKL